jgi:hypothetical protein
MLRRRVSSINVTTSNQVEYPSADEIATSDPDSAGLAQVREERELLLASIRNLTHAQLIARDTELGLRAELSQARIDLVHARARGAHDLAMTRLSVTWRVGRYVLRPVAIAKNFLRKLKK